MFIRWWTGRSPRCAASVPPPIAEELERVLLADGRVDGLEARGDKRVGRVRIDQVGCDAAQCLGPANAV